MHVEFDSNSSNVGVFYGKKLLLTVQTLQGITHDSIIRSVSFPASRIIESCCGVVCVLICKESSKWNVRSSKRHLGSLMCVKVVWGVFIHAWRVS